MAKAKTDSLESIQEINAPKETARSAFADLKLASVKWTHGNHLPPSGCSFLMAILHVKSSTANSCTAILTTHAFGRWDLTRVTAEKATQARGQHANYTQSVSLDFKMRQMC